MRAKAQPHEKARNHWNNLAKLISILFSFGKVISVWTMNSELADTFTLVCWSEVYVVAMYRKESLNKEQELQQREIQVELQ